jgi:hypothetical protein
VTRTVAFSPSPTVTDVPPAPVSASVTVYDVASVSPAIRA